VSSKRSSTCDVGCDREAGHARCITSYACADWRIVQLRALGGGTRNLGAGFGMGVCKDGMHLTFLVTNGVEKPSASLTHHGATRTTATTSPGHSREVAAPQGAML